MTRCLSVAPVFVLFRAVVGLLVLGLGLAVGSCRPAPSCSTTARPSGPPTSSSGAGKSQAESGAARRLSGEHVSRSGASNGSRAATASDIARYERVALALIRVQALMDWGERTRGERTFRAETYAGRNWLFRKDVVESLNLAVRHLAGRGQKAGRKALEFLREFVAQEIVNRATASLEDRRGRVESGLKVKLPWLADAVSFRSLDGLLAREKDAKRRAEIVAARSKAVEDHINPILKGIYEKAHAVARSLGYQSYFDLSQRVRRTDVGRLIRQGAQFVTQTDETNRKLLDRLARESLGIGLDRFTRADHLRLMRAPRTEKFLPARLMVPAFRFFLRGIGLDLRTSAGTKIVIDDSPAPNKHPRAACFPIVVPSDVRVSVKPGAGLDAWTTMFHEGGHALHYSWTRQARFEFRQLGSASATEAFAELFARVWAEPAWLKRYRSFLRHMNRRPPKASDLLSDLRRRPWFVTAEAGGMVLPRRALVWKRLPLPSDKDLASVIRHRVAWELYLYRRYGWAKLVYESRLHGAPASLYQEQIQGQTSDLKSLYGKLFSRAYGYELTERDLTSYLADVDPFFYAADYARAFLAADILGEHLRRKFGDDWYDNKLVGPYLKTLWEKGNEWTAEELVEHLGYTLDYRVTRARLARLLAAADALDGTKPSARHRVRGGGRGRTREARPCRPQARPRPGTLCAIPGLGPRPGRRPRRSGSRIRPRKRR